MTAQPLFPDPRPKRRVRCPRTRAAALVVAVASELARQGIEPRSRLVFAIARAAGAAPFRRQSGLLWLADRPTGPRKLAPRTGRERSRRILVAVFKAVERVDGKGRGIVGRVRRAASVDGGARFHYREAASWLRRFIRPGADGRTENLRQYRATRDSLRGSVTAKSLDSGTDFGTDI
jgi:hypothetical protein